MALRERTIEHSHRGTRFEGLFVRDEDFGESVPCVIVAHTIRGRSDFEDGKARALAALGYAALSIDLYGRDSRHCDLDGLRALMNGLRADRPALRELLESWVASARSQSEVNAGRIAAIGYCFGGLCVLDIARASPDVAGVVSFHGIVDAPADTADRPITAKVLVLHGWDDPLATPSQVQALAAELTSKGADWQIHAYGNTLHAFTNPVANDRRAGTVYDRDADRRSWAAMRLFLAELFGDQPAP